MSEAKRARIIRNGGTSRGAHIRAIWECLTTLIEHLPDFPSEKRVRLRTTRAALERAYPEFLGVNEVELAQWLAEEDGDEIEDTAV